MNSKNRKTLEAVFSHPTKSNIKWTDVKNLLLAVGAEKIECEGSRVCFVKGNVRMAFHRPHPGKEVKPYQVEAARDFLLTLEVTP